AAEASACAPPPALLADELQDVERLTIELVGPWPRAVRAIAALRTLRDRNGGRLTLDVEQQERFVRGCMVQPMCPLWLVDKVDPSLRPNLEAAKITATPEQLQSIEQALVSSTGKTQLP